MQAEILPETMENLKINASLRQIGIPSYFEDRLVLLDSHVQKKVNRNK
jgi:hypothetical protein